MESSIPKNILAILKCLNSEINKYVKQRLYLKITN